MKAEAFLVDAIVAQWGFRPEIQRRLPSGELVPSEETPVLVVTGKRGFLVVDIKPGHQTLTPGSSASVWTANLHEFAAGNKGMIQTQLTIAGLRKGRKSDKVDPRSIFTTLRKSNDEYRAFLTSVTEIGGPKFG